MRQTTALIASAAIAFAAASAATPAAAADDLGSNPITEFFDSLGMGSKEKPDIDYQERAPLVPPTSNASLPQPQEKGATARANAQWPNDPDAQRRAEARARANVVTTESNNWRMDRNSRIDPDELGARRTSGASVPATAADATTQDNTVTRLSAQELSVRRNPTADPGRASATTRQKLSDPPPGYLSSPAGGGVTAQAAPAEDKPWFRRMFGN